MPSGNKIIRRNSTVKFRIRHSTRMEWADIPVGTAVVPKIPLRIFLPTYSDPAS